jgi:tetratricopeptide (TPR) repeat protein
LEALADLAQSELELAYATSVAGKPEAADFAASATKRYQRLVEKQADNAVWRLGLLESRAASLGLAQFRGERAGQREELKDLADQALRLVEQEPRNIEYQGALSNLYETLADAYAASGRIDDALLVLEGCRHRLDGVSKKFPDATVVLKHIVSVQSTMADLEQRRGNYEAALAAYRTALTQSEQVLSRDRLNVDWRRHRNLARSRVAQVLSLMGRCSEALELLFALEVDTRELIASHQDHSQLRRDLAVHLGDVGQCQQELGKPELALAAQRENVLISDELAASSDNPLYTVDLVASLAMLAEALVGSNRPDEATAQLERAYQLARKVAARPDAPLAWRLRLAEAALRLGDQRLEAKQMSAAEVLFQEALAIAEGAVREAPLDGHGQSQLADCRSRMFNLAVSRSSRNVVELGTETLVEYAKASRLAEGDAELAARLEDAIRVVAELLRNEKPVDQDRALARLRQAALDSEPLAPADGILEIGQFLALVALGSPQRAEPFLKERILRKPGAPDLRCDEAELALAIGRDEEHSREAVKACEAGADRAELRLVAQLLKFTLDSKSVPSAFLERALQDVEGQKLKWTFIGLENALAKRQGLAAARLARLLRTVDESPPQGRTAAVMAKY